MLDKIFAAIVIVALSVMFGAGFFIGLIWPTEEALVKNDSYYCLKGQVVVNPNAPFDSVIIGESMICARDWKLTGIYGPTLDELDGPIEFSDLVEEVGGDDGN